MGESMKIHEYVPGHFDRDIIAQKIRRMRENKPCRCGCCGHSAEENSQMIGQGVIPTCSGITPETSDADVERSH